MHADRASTPALVLVLLLVGALITVGCAAKGSITPAPTASTSPTLSAVRPSEEPSASRGQTPIPDDEATPWPDVASMAPSADDVLALAGRDGVPGLLYCANMPFTFDALTRPTDAEDRVGPEYDALRTVTGGDPEPGAVPRADPTYREVSRDANHVLFLHEHDSTDDAEGHPYHAVKVRFDGTSWRAIGGGDCWPRAVPSPGYWQATWILDPEFRAPGAGTRTLHILVRELACASGRGASSRISPAFVTWSDWQVDIEVFVQALPGEGDCLAAPATPATLRLPITLGKRALFDPGKIGLAGSGG